MSHYLDQIEAMGRAALSPEIAPGIFALMRRPLPDRPGYQAAEIVLAHVPDNSVTPFVTWQRNTADGSRYWGHYHGPDELIAAVLDFQTR